MTDNHALPAENEMPPDDDQTVVRPRPVPAATEEGEGAATEAGVRVDADATVIRSRLPAEAPDDDTIVVRPRPRAEGPDDDPTVVRARPVPTRSSTDDNRTIVRARPVVDDLALDDDDTLERARPETTVEASDDDTVVHPVSHARPVRPVPPVPQAPEAQDHRGDPVPDPGQTADSAARLAQVARWATSAAASAEDGTSRLAPWSRDSMPRVYGPRPIVTEFSPAPEVTDAGGVDPVHPRAQLPSLARRDRRARTITLVGYAVAICVAGVGLWFVATLAFAR